MFALLSALGKSIVRPAFRGSTVLMLSIFFAVISLSSVARGQEQANTACARPAIGSVVAEPKDLRSENGVLRVELTVRNHKEKNGSVNYCYLLKDGSQSPTLRLRPGDTLVLKLKNELTALNDTKPTPHTHVLSTEK